MNSDGYNIPKGTKKIRTGNYVIYDIDYLLEHLAREISTLYESREYGKQLKEVKDDILFGKGCIKCPSHSKCADAFQEHSHGCGHYNLTEEEFEELRRRKDSEDNL